MGYPPEDLLLNEGFIDASAPGVLRPVAVDNLPPILVGTVVPEGTSGVTLGAVQ